MFGKKNKNPAPANPQVQNAQPSYVPQQPDFLQGLQQTAAPSASQFVFDPNTQLYYDTVNGAYIDPTTGTYVQQPLQQSQVMYDPATGAYMNSPAGTYTQQPLQQPQLMYDPATGAYIDPTTGAYVQQSLQQPQLMYDPATGAYIDPTTGAYVQQSPQQPQLMYDPATGAYIDPATGTYVQQPLQQAANPTQPTQFEQILQQEGMQIPQQAPVLEVKPGKYKKRIPHHFNWKVFLLVAVVLGILVFFFVNNKTGTGSTAVVQAGQLGETHNGDALIVRNETAYDEEGVRTIDYVAEEGSVVPRGSIICYVYSTGYSTKEATTLQDDRDAIRDYQQSLLAAETTPDQEVTRLDTEAIQCALEVRSLVQGARGSLINQEKMVSDAIDARQSYFRTKYSSDMRLNRLYDDETSQEQRISSWVKQKVSTSDAIVSFYTDGFEEALSPDLYATYTPSEVRAMMNGKKPEVSTAARGRTTMYRMVQQGNYAVLLLIKNTTWNPEVGSTYKLVLEQFSDTVADAQVLSVARSGGELLIRLAVLGDVKDVLYLRTCTATLGAYADCLLVPESAITVNKDSVEGVVVAQDGGQYFVPVTVLSKEGGTAYISPVQTGTLKENDVVWLYN